MGGRRKEIVEGLPELKVEVRGDEELEYKESMEDGVVIKNHHEKYMEGIRIREPRGDKFKGIGYVVNNDKALEEWSEVGVEGYVPDEQIIMRELAWHHTAVRLKATGASNTEVARVLGKSVVEVGRVVNQIWFQNRLREYIEGDEFIKGLEMRLRGRAGRAVEVLSEAMDNTGVSSLQVKAADSVLDRALGKATQKMEVENRYSIDMDNIEELRRRKEELERQLNGSGVIDV